MRRIIATALALSLVLQLGACMSAPRPVASPRTFIPIRKPERIWLTDNEGNRVEVMRPRALGDTLFGRTRQGEEVWIAFADAPRIEARELDKTKTYALVGAVIAAGALVFAFGQGGGEPYIPENEDRPRTPVGIILFRR